MESLTKKIRKDPEHNWVNLYLTAVKQNNHCTATNEFRLDAD